MTGFPSPRATIRRGVAIAVVACPVWAGPADRFGGIEIKATHVAGPVHMLEGAGGNIGVSAGADGVLIVDEAEWGSGFISEGRWISIVEQSERGVSPSF